MKYRFFLLSLLLLLPLTTTSCNTMQGLGTDIKKGGEKLEQSAEDSKGY